MSASRAKFINDYLHRFSNGIEINDFNGHSYQKISNDFNITVNYINENNNLIVSAMANKNTDCSVIEDIDAGAISIVKYDEKITDLDITNKIEEDTEENATINIDEKENEVIKDNYIISDSSINIMELGKKIKNDLYHKYGDDLYNAWFSNLYLIKINNDNTATFSVLTLFIKEWIMSHYIDDLENMIKNHIEYINGIEIIVNADLIIENNEYCKLSEQSIEISNDCDFLDPRFTFDNFVVGKSNELAFAAARRVAESTVPVGGSNPLFLYGGVGLGKTHLMHAIAWHIKTKFPNRKVIYLSAEKFMYQYIMALRNKDIMLFKERYRSVDVLMVDDVQFISGKDSTQEEFFHTFNALIDQSKQLVISADRSPSSLNGVEERIKSRLGWGLVADINDTTFELRMGILQSKVSSLGINIPSKVLEFLAQQIESNVRELEGALNKVIAHSSLLGSGITIEGTEEILSDLLHSSKRKLVEINEIQRIVAHHYKIKVACLTSSSRSREFSHPRQIAMYLAKTMTKESLPSIGRNFGGRDHATVIHAVKKIEKIMGLNSGIDEDVKTLTKLIMTSN